MHSQLLNSILQQNASGLPVKEFLQQVVKDHPYFTPAQFFLLKQLDEKDAGYAEQVAKTALLFNNPHWLHFKLQQAAAAKPAPVISMYAENNDNDDDNAALVQEIASPAAEITTLTAEPLVAPAAVSPAEASPQETDNDDDQAVMVTAAVPGIIAAPSGELSMPQEETASPEMLKETADDNTETTEEAGTNTHEPMPNIKIALQAPVTGDTDESQLSFEPMHLVDYFASQGIKLSEELQTGDKLGKQLKSFTEWLKTMKKVHNAGAPGVSGSAEVAVQALAEKSNAENEVLTEAMAQVFTQQGKTGKAIELYEKLSLLNPAKSAYFAAQIEKLKG